MNLMPQGADILAQINNFVIESNKLADALKSAENKLAEVIKANELLKKDILTKDEIIEGLKDVKESLATSNAQKDALIQEKEQEITKANEIKELWRVKFQKTLRENNALKLKVKKLANPNKFIVAKLKNFLQMGEDTLAEIYNLQFETIGPIRESPQSDDENVIIDSNTDNYELLGAATNKRLIEGDENDDTSIKKVKLAEFIVKSNSSDGTDNGNKRKDQSKVTDQNMNDTDEIISSSDKANDKDSNVPDKNLSVDQIWSLYKSRSTEDSDSDQFAPVEDKEIDIGILKRHAGTELVNHDANTQGVSENLPADVNADQSEKNNGLYMGQNQDESGNSTDDDFQLVSGFISQGAITSTSRDENGHDDSNSQIDVEATIDLTVKDSKIIGRSRNRKKLSKSKKKVRILDVHKEEDERQDLQAEDAIILEDDDDEKESEEVKRFEDAQEGIHTKEEKEDHKNGESPQIRESEGDEEKGNRSTIDTTNINHDYASQKTTLIAEPEMEPTDNIENENIENENTANENMENEGIRDENMENENMENENIENENIENENIENENTENENIGNDNTANNEEASASANQVDTKDNENHNNSLSPEKENILVSTKLSKENQSEKDNPKDISVEAKSEQYETEKEKQDDRSSEQSAVQKENVEAADTSFAQESNSSVVSNNKPNADMQKIQINFYYVNELLANLNMTENQKHISRKKLSDKTKSERYCYFRVRKNSSFSKIMKNISRKFSIPLKRLRLFTLDNRIISPVALVNDIFDTNRTRLFVDVVSVGDPDDFIEGKILSSD